RPLKVSRAEPGTPYPNPCAVMLILTFYREPPGESRLVKERIPAAVDDDNSLVATPIGCGPRGVGVKPFEQRSSSGPERACPVACPAAGFRAFCCTAER